MKNLKTAIRSLLLAVAAAALPGCVTETVVDTPPSIKWPQQQQKHGFFDFLHFWGHPHNTTQTVVESPYPLYQPPSEPTQ